MICSIKYGVIHKKEKSFHRFSTGREILLNFMNYRHSLKIDKKNNTPNITANATNSAYNRYYARLKKNKELLAKGSIRLYKVGGGSEHAK